MLHAADGPFAMARIIQVAPLTLTAYRETEISEGGTCYSSRRVGWRAALASKLAHQGSPNGTTRIEISPFGARRTFCRASIRLTWCASR